MYDGVPTIEPETDSEPLPSSFLASPKSVTWGWPSAIEQDVRGLQVAVQDAPLMGVVHRPRDLGHQPRRLARLGRVLVQDARPGSGPRPASC